MMSKKSETSSLRSMQSQQLTLNADAKTSGSFNDVDGPSSLHDLQELVENDTPSKRKKKRRRRSKRTSSQVSMAGNKHTAKYILTHTCTTTITKKKNCSLMPPFSMPTCNCLVRCYLRFLSSQSLTAYSVSEESG